MGECPVGPRCQPESDRCPGLRHHALPKLNIYFIQDETHKTQNPETPFYPQSNVGNRSSGRTSQNRHWETPLVPEFGAEWLRARVVLGTRRNEDEHGTAPSPQETADL